MFDLEKSYFIYLKSMKKKTNIDIVASRKNRM